MGVSKDRNKRTPTLLSTDENRPFDEALHDLSLGLMGSKKESPITHENTPPNEKEYPVTWENKSKNPPLHQETPETEIKLTDSEKFAESEHLKRKKFFNRVSSQHDKQNLETDLSSSSFDSSATLPANNVTTPLERFFESFKSIANVVAHFIKDKITDSIDYNTFLTPDNNKDEPVKPSRAVGSVEPFIETILRKDGKKVKTTYGERTKFESNKKPSTSKVLLEHALKNPTIRKAVEAVEAVEAVDAVDAVDAEYIAKNTHSQRSVTVKNNESPLFKEPPKKETSIDAFSSMISPFEKETKIEDFNSLPNNPFKEVKDKNNNKDISTSQLPLSTDKATTDNQQINPMTDKKPSTFSKIKESLSSTLSKVKESLPKFKSLFRKEKVVPINYVKLDDEIETKPSNEVSKRYSTRKKVPEHKEPLLDRTSTSSITETSSWTQRVTTSQEPTECRNL